MVRLADVTPSPRPIALAGEVERDPRLVEVILRESRRVVRQAKGVLIVETHHGWVCANAGVDQSNVDADTACLLPEDSDALRARRSATRMRALTGHDLAIIIADTFGRPWREGLANVAVGMAGFAPLKSYLGELRSRRPRRSRRRARRGRRAGGGRRAGDGQARPHPRGHRARPRLGAGATEGSERCCAIPRATCSGERRRDHMKNRDPRRYRQGGRGLGARWAQAGHEIIIGSRDAERAHTKAAELRRRPPAARDQRQEQPRRRRARRGRRPRVARGRALANTLPELREACRGKVVVSTVVPLTFGGGRLFTPPPRAPPPRRRRSSSGPRREVVAAFHHIAAHELSADRARRSNAICCSAAATPTPRRWSPSSASSMGLRAVDVGPLTNAGPARGHHRACWPRSTAATS